MSLYSKEMEREYIARVRRIMVQSRYISAKKVKEALETDSRHPLKLSLNYVDALMKKIRRARASDVERHTKSFVIGEFSETVGFLNERLWMVLNSEKTSPMTKVAAAKAIAELESMRIEKIFDSGLLERELGNITLTQRSILKAEVAQTATQKTLELIQSQMSVRLPLQINATNNGGLNNTGAEG